MSNQKQANAKTTAALGQHVMEASHTFDMSDYNAHGHAAGRQGTAGHTIPNDAHKQDGASVP